MSDIKASSVTIDNPSTTDDNAEDKKSFFSSWTFIILVCIVLPIAFRSMLFAPFHIPSGSMKPTMLIGDFLFVSKYSYGYSKYSFPFALAPIDNRTSGDTPTQGEIIVFRPPPQDKTDYIKRLVGMPGDTVQMKNSRLYLNDTIVPRRRVDDFVEIQPNGKVKRIPRYIETLPNGLSHYTLDEKTDGDLDNTPKFTVPEGSFFFLGDNRDNSADSRTDLVGFVPQKYLIGRAEVLFLSATDNIWKIWEWPGIFRSDRIFTSVDQWGKVTDAPK